MITTQRDYHATRLNFRQTKGGGEMASVGWIVDMVVWFEWLTIQEFPLCNNSNHPTIAAIPTMQRHS